VDRRQLATETESRTVGRRTYHGSHWRSSLSRWSRPESLLTAGVLTGIAVVVLGLLLPSSRHRGVVASSDTVPHTVGRRTYHGSHWHSPLSRWSRPESLLTAGVLTGIAIVVLGLLLPTSRHDGVVALPLDAPTDVLEHRSGGPSPSASADQPAPDTLVSPSPAAPGTPATPDTPARDAERTKPNATTSAPANCATSLQRPGPASYYRPFTCPTDAGGRYAARYTGFGRWTRYR
jgi:hypothetical protein